MTFIRQCTKFPRVRGRRGERLLQKNFRHVGIIGDEGITVQFLLWIIFLAHYYQKQTTAASFSDNHFVFFFPLRSLWFLHD